MRRRAFLGALAALFVVRKSSVVEPPGWMAVELGGRTVLIRKSRKIPPSFRFTYDAALLRRIRL